MPGDIVAERGWKALQVEGPLPFDMVGVLSSLTVPLGECGISVFVLSTFDTDLILVRADSFESACQSLIKAGHTID